MSNSFVENLRKIRLEKNLTQSEVAKRMGVSRAWISQVEAGTTNLTDRTKYRLADALDVSVETLMGIEADQHEDANSNSIDIKNLTLKNDIHVILIPIVGEVRAGVSMYAQSNIIGYQKVDSDLINENETYFYLKVVGDSMDRIIKEGDLVLVKHTPCIESGDIVIAMTSDDEATIKKVKLMKDSIALIPESTNSVYKTTVYNPDEIRFIGKVIKAERYF